MGIMAVLAALILAQDPVDAGATRVQVELDSGAALVGVIETRSGDYLELRLDDGSLVGFGTERVLEITTAAAMSVLQRAGLSERDEHFALHDAAGVAVGTLHATVVPTPSGRVRLSEEWAFRSRGEVVAVTQLEVVTADLAPLWCFYHERRQRRSDRKTLAERLLRAEVDEGKLVVEILSDSGRERREYPFESGTSFPLLWRESLRQGVTDGASVSVFDPGQQEFVARSASTRFRRAVPWRGEVVGLQELRVQFGDREHVEWLDASAGSLRREVNGPALVAVPTPAHQAERYAKVSAAVFGATRIESEDGQVALWLPDPSWSGSPQGQNAVRLTDPSEAAIAEISSWHDLEADAGLWSKAETIERTLRLRGAGWTVEGRDAVAWRGREAVRLSLQLPEGRADLWVADVADHTVALWLRAPDRLWPRVEDEFNRILDSAEWRRPDLERDPVARRARRGSLRRH